MNFFLFYLDFEEVTRFLYSLLEKIKYHLKLLCYKPKWEPVVQVFELVKVSVIVLNEPLEFEKNVVGVFYFIFYHTT